MSSGAFFETTHPKPNVGRPSVASRIEKSAEGLNKEETNNHDDSDDETKDFWKPNHRTRACGICHSRDHKTVDCDDRKAFLAS